MFYWQPNQLPVLLAAQAQATSYIGSPSTANQFYWQPRHRQPVTLAAQAQATSYRRSASTGNQLYKPKQTVIDAGVKVKVRDPLGPPEPLY